MEGDWGRVLWVADMEYEQWQAGRSGSVMRMLRGVIEYSGARLGIDWQQVGGSGVEGLAWEGACLWPQSQLRLLECLYLCCACSAEALLINKGPMRASSKGAHGCCF